MHKIWKFAITGGPCGGKTSGIPIVKKFFESRGFKVFTLPEAASLINKQIGLGFEEVSVYDFQSLVTDTMIFFEDKFVRYANFFEQDVIILCDRGIQDNKAYMPYEEFLALLQEHNLSESDVLERYDAVFHLVTAADGAEEFYKLEGARHEDPETARALDKKTLDSWISHPNLHVIDNSTDFDSKIYRLIWKIIDIVI